MSHAPLSTRKAIFARTAVLDAFCDLEERGCTSLHQAEAEAAREHLLDQCTLEASREDADSLPLDSERLDAMAGHVASFAHHRSALASASGNVPLSTMLADVATRLGLVDCDRCARLGGHDRPCGDPDNQSLVESRGECLRDLKDLYTFALSLGRELYSDAWGDGGPTAHVDLELRTCILAASAPTRGHARLAGRTDFHFDGTRHRSVITLGVDGSAYTALERDAAIYYLAHEVVAHGYYDAFASGARSHRDPHDVWADGWMDCIAADLLTSALENGATGGTPSRLRANRACVDAIQRCHVERYTPGAGERSHVSNGMRLARRRFLAMRSRLGLVDQTSSFDAMRSVHLAFAIVNAKGAAFDTVAAINSAASAFAFGAASGSGLTTGELRFYRAVTTFIDHRDETKLIGDLA